VLFVGAIAAGCTPSQVAAPAAAPASVAAAALEPPIARVVPKVDTLHGDIRVDDYFWLRDDERKDPEVIAYLEAENAYTKAVMQPTEALQEQLYREMLGRIQQTDLSVPERIGEYYYYSRTIEGQQYPILARRKGSLEAPEEVMLDQNEMAQGTRYFRLGLTRVSPDARLLAFTVDTTGAERFTLMVKDLATGEILPDRIGPVSYSLQWAADNRTLFYTVGDAANRPYKVLRHTLGSTAPAVEIAHEPDELFRLGVSKTKDGKYLLIGSGSFDADEYRYLSADQPNGEWKLIRPRQQGVEYSVEHHDGRFVITTNADGARDFKVVTAPATAPARWTDLVPASDSVLVQGVDIFRDHLVLYERAGGNRRIRVREWRGGESYVLDFPEEVYTVYGGANPEYDSRLLRFTYTSLVTPASVYDFDLKTRERELKKQTEVLGGYDATQYGTERTWARASDGTMVPVSLVYRKPFAKDGTRPLLLYAYGSYGSSTDPTFSSANLSLLDRGVVYAIAHIRGGQEMGRRWYDEGKLLNKRNTFTDFVAAAEHLVGEGYTSRERLAIRGGSAGGLLMGAVVNLRPDLFRAVVADVPFVDVVNTMLDASIPLTTGEWIQWGNPNEKLYYDYMKSYSPYDNVERKAYPAMLVTTGLNDPRVAYWEPAKWVAKLRAHKTDTNPLLLYTHMGAGHGGSSGRYDALREAALRYAFLLQQLGVEG
jgi:oligopeptidase B